MACALMVHSYMAPKPSTGCGTGAGRSVDPEPERRRLPHLGTIDAHGITSPTTQTIITSIVCRAALSCPSIPSPTAATHDALLLRRTLERLHTTQVTATLYYLSIFETVAYPSAQH